MRTCTLVAACLTAAPALFGAQKNTRENMMARMDRVVRECRQAQSSLDAGKVDQAKRHLNECNAMLAQMQEEHRKMGGDMTHANTAPGTYSGTNPSTNQPATKH